MPGAGADERREEAALSIAQAVEARSELSRLEGFRAPILKVV